jgi:predicted SAM-dependent methyltransferase
MKREQVESFIEAKKKATLLRADCGKPLPFSDSSVDHIYCSHFLEHLYRDNAIETIKGFYKLLKRGGTIHIIVPDLGELVDNYVKNKDADKFIESTTLAWPKRPSFLYRFFSVIGSYGLTHLWMYDKQSLTKIIIDAGFTIIPLEEVPVSTIKREGLHITARKS